LERARKGTLKVIEHSVLIVGPSREFVIDELAEMDHPAPGSLRTMAIEIHPCPQRFTWHLPEDGMHRGRALLAATLDFRGVSMA